MCLVSWFLVLMKDVKNVEAKFLRSWRTCLFLGVSSQVQALRSTLVLSLLMLQRKRQWESVTIGLWGAPAPGQPCTPWTLTRSNAEVLIRWLAVARHSSCVIPGLLKVTVRVTLQAESRRYWRSESALSPSPSPVRHLRLTCWLLQPPDLSWLSRTHCRDADLPGTKLISGMPERDHRQQHLCVRQQESEVDYLVFKLRPHPVEEMGHLSLSGRIDAGQLRLPNSWLADGILIWSPIWSGSVHLWPRRWNHWRISTYAGRTSPPHTGRPHRNPGQGRAENLQNQTTVTFHTRGSSRRVPPLTSDHHGAEQQSQQDVRASSSHLLLHLQDKVFFCWL